MALPDSQDRTVVPVPASVPSAVWVIVRSTGEYSDRDKTPIRFCLSEEEAREAVALISVEKQRDARPPYPHREPTHAWFNADGTMTEDWRAAQGSFLKKPDGDEIEARNEVALEIYREAVAKLHHVDPDGSWVGDHYYYAEVELWTAQGIEARSDDPTPQPMGTP